MAHPRKLLEAVNFGGYGGDRALIENQIKISLGGEVACGLFVGRQNWESAEKDIQTCFSLSVSQCGDDEEANAYINWLLLSVRNELNLPHNWARVCAVAKALIQKKTLGYHKVRKIIQDAKDEYIS